MEHKYLMELWFFLGVALETLVNGRDLEQQGELDSDLVHNDDPYAKEPSIYDNPPPGNFPRTKSTFT